MLVNLARVGFFSDPAHTLLIFNWRIKRMPTHNAYNASICHILLRPASLETSKILEAQLRGPT